MFATAITNFPSNAIACEAVMANAKSYDGKKIAQIPVELLNLDSYQRNEGPTVASIAKHWDERKCDPLLVSYRDGNFYVVDGQHRLAAAKLIGKKDITCVIFEMNRDEEVRHFMTQRDNVRNLSAYQQMWAGREGGDELATSVFRVFADMEIELVDGRRCKLGDCCAVATARNICDKYGEDGLRAVLKTIQQIGWRYTRGGLSSPCLRAFKNLYRYTGGNQDVMRQHASAAIRARSYDIVVAEAHAAYPGRGETSALSEYLLHGAD